MQIKIILCCLLVFRIFSVPFSLASMRIDIDQGSMANIHNRFQIFGTCYANAAVDLFDSYRLKKQTNNLKVEYGSALLVSVLTSLEKYKKKDPKFLIEWARAYPEKITKRPFDGGRICQALNTINKYGIYTYNSLEMRIFSILDIDNNGSKEDEQKLEKFFLEDLRIIYLKKDIFGLIRIFPDLSIKKAKISLKKRSYLDFLSQLMMGIGTKIPMKKDKLFCREKKIREVNINYIKEIIFRSLSSDQMPPIAINYYTFPLKEDYVFVDGEKRGAHVATIIGKQINESSHVEVLIKDTSYSPVFSSKLKHIDEHHFWIELDVLLKNATRISYFEK